MAIFKLSLSESDYLVTKEESSTSCSTMFSYRMEASKFDDIDITLSGNHQNAYYIANGGPKVYFTNSVSGISFGKTLVFYFHINNSGVSGIFLESDVSITNNSSSNFDKTYEDTAIRANDDQNCDDKPSPSDSSCCDTYVHDQGLPNSIWSISHNLEKFPSVSVVDSGGAIVIGQVEYVNLNTITITFSSAFSGKAYLN
tara:strand:+ start:2882 stop:3478 length:597 start_codon:yes stop_codon:yes gene_type:complete